MDRGYIKAGGYCYHPAPIAPPPQAGWRMGEGGRLRPAALAGYLIALGVLIQQVACLMVLDRLGV